MNKVVLIGRPTKQPELKYTPGTGTPVCTMTLAVERPYSKDGQKEADFIPVVIWGKPAENTANYVGKGKLVAVSGRIQTRSYDAKDGSKRYVTEVVAEDVQFLEWSTNSTNNSIDNSVYDEMTPVDDGQMPF
ncbi:single-stranded DNA-binding protein [Clostridium omnivorum]|uniref:Single-stranded DNA-binding protein n=1 Tax=Clostridium omnivorum TaxID=1604902 RepID=A0ABQ5NCE5_9CLOT|nr:single-stranded DNA-binding protein [Clostridium sp. E14]GLC32896.1 single-stranded DNA-binding protein 3 [Clostridium sp. E14]